MGTALPIEEEALPMPTQVVVAVPNQPRPASAAGVFRGASAPPAGSRQATVARTVTGADGQHGVGAGRATISEVTTTDARSRVQLPHKKHAFLSYQWDV